MMAKVTQLDTMVATCLIPIPCYKLLFSAGFPTPMNVTVSIVIWKKILANRIQQSVNIFNQQIYLSQKNAKRVQYKKIDQPNLTHHGCGWDHGNKIIQITSRLEP